MKYGKKEGKGVLIFSNGDIYEGEFKNNEITGKGHKKWKIISSIVMNI